MAILQIQSEDKDFSYIIKKNPQSPMLLRNIRKGTAFAWYSKNNTAYNIFFKDADNEVSFGDQEFEYLNSSKYNSPIFVLNAITEFFSFNIKNNDENYSKKSFYINMIKIPYIHQLKNFQKYFPNFEIEYEEYISKSYSIKTTTNESFNMLFNYINLLMLFITLTNKNEYFNLNKSSIEKYLLSIERLDAPFFIRYLFSRNILKSRKNFSYYKDRLEKSTLYNTVKMKFGDTATQRRNFIKEHIPFNKQIIDIGCGEGSYALPFAKINKDFPYIAIDIEKELTDIINKKAKNKEIENIKTFNDINDYISLIKNNKNEKKSDIILTEVIEHMPKNKSFKLVENIFQNLNFDTFIITVPNKEFNQFYLIKENEFRHHDHNWEPDFNEFKEFINTAIKDFNFNYEFVKIGDEIDGISTSIGCILKNNEIRKNINNIRNKEI